jgi:hypothetical protein
VITITYREEEHGDAERSDASAIRAEGKLVGVAEHQPNQEPAVGRSPNPEKTPTTLREDASVAVCTPLRIAQILELSPVEQMPA